MALPLYLAMTPAEMSSNPHLPGNIAWMACHFSPYAEGLTNLPRQLPPGAMLILNDRMPCQGHSPDLVVRQLGDALRELECGMVLLDFQRPPEPESKAMVRAVVEGLSCPAAVFAAYAKDLDCPVFLPPSPLHRPLAEHLAPWAGREIWLEAALCQEELRVTKEGVTPVPQFPPEGLEGGFWEAELCCRYRTRLLPDEVRFTLFDTRESLGKKLEQAQALGVAGAVGLYQELHS